MSPQERPRGLLPAPPPRRDPHALPLLGLGVERDRVHADPHRSPPAVGGEVAGRAAALPLAPAVVSRGDPEARAVGVELRPPRAPTPLWALRPAALQGRGARGAGGVRGG